MVLIKLKTAKRSRQDNKARKVDYLVIRTFGALCVFACVMF